MAIESHSYLTSWANPLANDHWRLILLSHFLLLTMSLWSCCFLPRLPDTVSSTYLILSRLHRPYVAAPLSKPLTHFLSKQFLCNSVYICPFCFHFLRRSLTPSRVFSASICSFIFHLPRYLSFFTCLVSVLRLVFFLLLTTVLFCLRTTDG